MFAKQTPRVSYAGVLRNWLGGCSGAISLKNSRLISAVFGSAYADWPISIGCSLLLAVLSGVS